MNLTKREKTGLIIFISILLCVISYNYFSNRKSNIEVLSKDNKSIKSQNSNNTGADKKVSAYICGEVKNPGVYSVQEGDRIITLVNMAGGFTDNADRNSINLSSKVKDEDQITVFSKLENINQTGIQNNNASSASINKKININTADESQLESLPRIGKALAQRIIDYRNANGSFKKIEDITNVSGIGQKTFEGFKDKITVN